ncbi:MAG: HigA family addiction module antidote protein [Treponema sp.]|jgi:addiction module HigA family antidote|nr:HigA family addiction module antidote protein [Treponema sp.]
MPKKTLTPGTALTALLDKHGLNYNRLAKAIGISSAMVRLIALDENPVSAPVAFRLAKFFKTTPEHWLALQIGFETAQAAADKKLAKALKDIPTVDKATFERKRKAKKPAKPAGKGKAAAGKKTAKPGRPAKKAAKPAAKKPGRPAKSAKPKKAAAAGTAKRGRPAAKPGPAKKVRPVQEKSPPGNTPPAAPPAEVTVNEPQI